MSSTPAALPCFEVALGVEINKMRELAAGQTLTASTIAKLLIPRIFAGFRLHCPVWGQLWQYGCKCR